MMFPRASYLFLLTILVVGAVVVSACGALPNLRAQPSATLIPLPTLGNSNPPVVPATLPATDNGEPVGTAPATSTSTPPATTTPPATATAPATPTEPATPALPTAISVQVVPTKRPTFTPIPPSAGTTQVKIFLIAIGDNGVSGPMVGCGDSVIAVTRVVPATQGPLKAALNQLLSLHDQFYGQSGLYNALYRANLNIESVTIVNGLATINLTGTLSLGGVCDNPRVEAQLTNTALQFSTVRTVDIFLNGKPLKDALSQK